MQNLVPSPGMESGSPALGMWSLSHWTTRKVPTAVLTCAKLRGQSPHISSSFHSLHVTGFRLGDFQILDTEQTFFFFSFLGCLAFRILVPQPGIQPGPKAVKPPNPSHWTAREFPGAGLLKQLLTQGNFSGCNWSHSPHTPPPWEGVLT